MQKVVFLLLIHAIAIAHEGNSGHFKIIFTDNTAATGGPNDIGQTGDLEFVYTHPDDRYKVSIKGEVFVNGKPNDTNITRVNPNNIRIDLLSVYLIQGDAFKYGMGVEILGNLGGGPTQNLIHKITSNPHIPAKYYAKNHATPTLNYEYKAKIFNNSVDFISTGKIALIAKNGISKFDAMMTYRYYNLYDWDIDAGSGLGFDCTKYPNILAFKGYPLRDYQVCTPETKLSLDYKNFHFFWEIPLMNRHVQNSVLGISYTF